MRQRGAERGRGRRARCSTRSACTEGAARPYGSPTIRCTRTARLAAEQAGAATRRALPAPTTLHRSQKWLNWVGLPHVRDPGTRRVPGDGRLGLTEDTRKAATASSAPIGGGVRSSGRYGARDLGQFKAGEDPADRTGGRIQSTRNRLAMMAAPPVERERWWQPWRRSQSAVLS